MAYNENLASRTREILAASKKRIEEKKMFGGLCFMVNGKMCVGVEKERLMVRIDPDIYDEVLEKEDCEPMTFTGKPMKGYVFVNDTALRSTSNLKRWLGKALAYNDKAKAYKRTALPRASSKKLRK
jgi:TfoX/Sxy family transcriptional regulator of competence genes